MAILVHNINGTSDNSCICGSWLKHWENFSGKKAGLCAEVSCQNKAEVGAHVQKEKSNTSKWYIIPLCSKHNNAKGQDIYVMDGTIFVSANTKETCSKYF